MILRFGWIEGPPNVESPGQEASSGPQWDVQCCLELGFWSLVIRRVDMTQNPVTWVKRSAEAISQNGGMEEAVLPGSRMPQLANPRTGQPDVLRPQANQTFLEPKFYRWRN